MPPDIKVRATDSQNARSDGDRQTVGSGAIKRAIAAIWLTVLSLPQMLAPKMVVWLTRHPAIASSRPKIKNTPHAGICPNSINISSGANTSSLSTNGSRNLPRSVTWFSRRAKYPSSQSVPAATKKIIRLIQRLWAVG